MIRGIVLANQIACLVISTVRIHELEITTAQTNKEERRQELVLTALHMM